MRYALLAYDLNGTLAELPADEKRHLHRRHRHGAGRRGVTPIGHYRFRPPRLVTAVDAPEGAIRTKAGAASETSAGLRALYILESENPDAVIAFAAELPAVEQGATVEIWPLAEPRDAR